MGQTRKQEGTMKTNLLRWASALLLATTMLAFMSCATMNGTETVTAIETPEGAIIVDTFTVFKRKLSIICAWTIGAVTRSSGSRAKHTPCEEAASAHSRRLSTR